MVELSLISDIMSGITTKELTILHPSIDRDHSETNATNTLHVEER